MVLPYHLKVDVIILGADLGAMRGLVKLYDINKACANGEYLRFDDLGKSATLYIE